MMKVGLVGAGFMGNMHATVYTQLPDVKLVGIADIEGVKAKSFADKFKTIPFFTPEELYKREDINLVDICLPTYLHKEYVIKAAEMGKDIICEKPIALTTEDADEMISICKKNKVRFAVAQVIRFWPEYKFLKELYDQEKYGKLKSITCTRLSPAPTWAWDNWLMKGKRSGGALIDLHIHDTDFLLSLLGKPEKIYSVGQANSESSFDHICSTFKFPNGAVAYAEGGWDMPVNYPFNMGYVANFEKATIEFNSRNSPTLTVYEASGQINRPVFEPKKSDGIEGNISDMGGYYYEIRYFVEHFTHNKPLGVVTPQDARDSLEIVLKERESAQSGKEIIL